jgi:hypothetical protein
MRQPRLSDLLHMSSDEWHRNIEQWQEEQAAMASNGLRDTYGGCAESQFCGGPLTEAPYSAPQPVTIDVTISTRLYAKAVTVRWISDDTWRVSAEIAVAMACGGKELTPTTQQISATVPRAEVGAAVQTILDTLNG